MNHNDTFFGGRQAGVLHIDGSTESIQVRQLLLVEYQTALKFQEDEFALTAFCCRRADSADAAPFNKDWINTLQPESYEAIQALVREVNAKGFFSFAARRQEKERQENERWIKAAAELPLEALKAAMDRGVELASRNSSLRPR